MAPLTIVPDAIYNNIEQTEVRTYDAKEEITQASTYQKKARNKMCIILAILVVVATVVTLILVL